MAKSRPKLKLVKKSVVRRLLPHPAHRATRSTQPRLAVRSARRRTRPPIAESNGVPLRTLARSQVLASAESLGVTLSKPQLRKAIDRTVKTLKSRVEDGEAKIGVRDTVDAEPASTAALGEVANDRPFSRSVLDEMSGVYKPFLGPLAARGQDHVAVHGPTPLAIPPTFGPVHQPPSQPSPWSSVYSALDESVQQLSMRVVQLANRLGPVLLPPQNPPAENSMSVAPTGTPHVLEGVEMQRVCLDHLCTRIAELIDRVVV